MKVLLPEFDCKKMILDKKITYYLEYEKLVHVESGGQEGCKKGNKEKQKRKKRNEVRVVATSDG